MRREYFACRFAFCVVAKRLFPAKYRRSGFPCQRVANRVVPEEWRRSRPCRLFMIAPQLFAAIVPLFSLLRSTPAPPTKWLKMQGCDRYEGTMAPESSGRVSFSITPCKTANAGPTHSSIIELMPQTRPKPNSQVEKIPMDACRRYFHIQAIPSNAPVDPAPRSIGLFLGRHRHCLLSIPGPSRRRHARRESGMAPRIPACLP